VVDPETGKAVAPGVKGLVKARGPQIMKGYFKASTLRSKSSAPSPVIDASCAHFVARLMNGDGPKPALKIFHGDQEAGYRCGKILNSANFQP
jgi:hypothetical protein